MNSSTSLFASFALVTVRVLSRHLKLWVFNTSNLFDEVGSINNPLHNVKVLTSFIRHNTFILKPLQVVTREGEVIYRDDLSKHMGQIRTIKKGREAADPINVSYKATGYADTQLDATSRLRK